MPNIRVMHFGLGPIGAAIVKQVAGRQGFKIVGAIDIDPAKAGRDLGDVVGLPKRLGVKVSPDAVKALKAAKPDVVMYQIVGLAKDAKYTNLREEFTPIAFVPSAQQPKTDPYLQVVLRSGVPLETLTSAVTAEVASAQPGAILEFQTMNTLIRESLLRERLMAMLSGFFGLLAGLLATIGLYGVMLAAFTCSARRSRRRPCC